MGSRRAVSDSDSTEDVDDERRNRDANADYSADRDGMVEPPAPRWYAIPAWRLVALSLLGGWFYQTYWMFRSWQAYRLSWGYSRAPEWHAVYERTGFRVSPFWRAVLGLYCYGLFVAVRREARVLGLKSWIAPWPMFAVWCLGSVFGELLDPWPFRALLALWFVPTQLAVNRLNQRVTGSTLREPMSSGELASALAGAVVLVLEFARSPQ